MADISSSALKPWKSRRHAGQAQQNALGAFLAQPALPDKQISKVFYISLCTSMIKFSSTEEFLKEACHNLFLRITAKMGRTW